MVVVRVRCGARQRTRERSTPAPTATTIRPDDQRQPRVEVLGQHVLGQPQGHEPEREHPDRVRDGDGRRRARPRGAACLGCRPGTPPPSPCRGRATARGARPSRTPRAAAAEHALAGGRVLEQAGEAVARRACGRDPPPSALGATSVPSAGPTRKPGLAPVERAVEQVLRIAPQPVGGVAAGASVRTAVPSPGRDTIAFQPDPALEGASCSVTRRGAVRRRRQRELHPGGVEAARRRAGG